MSRRSTKQIGRIIDRDRSIASRSTWTSSGGDRG